jgi:DNA adenine methylase
VNDVNGRAINYFRVLRESPEALLHLIHLTPWAEGELRRCLIPADDPLEDARRYFMACWMGIHGNPVDGYASGFRYQKSPESRFTSPALDAVNRSDLLVWAERLKNVQIFEREATEVIGKFLGESGCLIYFDPPYLPETRKRERGYDNEPSPAWHRYAAALLRQHKGYVVVAGYRSRLYERCYESYGWERRERVQSTNGATKGTECLWLSPRTVTALEKERKKQRSLFSVEGVPV